MKTRLSLLSVGCKGLRMLQNNQTSEIPSSLGEPEDSGLGRRRSQQSWLSEDRGPEPRHNFTLIGRVHASPALRLAQADWLTRPRRVQTVGVAMGYRQLRGTPEIFRQELRRCICYLGRTNRKGRTSLSLLSSSPCPSASAASESTEVGQRADCNVSQIPLHVRRGFSSPYT